MYTVGINIVFTFMRDRKARILPDILLYTHTQSAIDHQYCKNIIQLFSWEVLRILLFIWMSTVHIIPI